MNRAYINPEAVDPQYYVNDGTPEFEQSLKAVLPAGKSLERLERRFPEAVVKNWYHIINEPSGPFDDDSLEFLIGPGDVIMVLQRKVLLLSAHQFETLYRVGGITGSVAADIASRVLPGMTPQEVDTMYGEWLGD